MLRDNNLIILYYPVSFSTLSMRKIILLLLIFTSCKKSNDSPAITSCDPGISFSGQVRSIFVSNCTASGCHDGTDLPSLGDYIIDKDASVQIRDAVSRNIMPKNATLTSSDKAAILCWIDSGTKNN